MWTPSERYPDPSFEVLDPRFEKYILFNSRVERLYTGCRWSEGPAWFGDHRCLLWSDIPNDRVLKWDEETGETSVYRRGGFTNGNTRDRQGRFVSCQHGTRAITRTEPDGTITVLADRYQGKRLNSPNDIVVKSDNSIWFTDPSFGILSYNEGHKAEPELPTNVYRLEPDTGALEVVIEGINQPNGLCFSPDEDLLYLVESRSEPRKIHVYDVTDDGKAVTNKRLFVDAGEKGTPDGFRCDVDGNLWAGWGMAAGLDGVRIFAPDGTAIGHIHLPERCANLCFGGRERTRLFMAASKSLYAVHVNTQGVPYG